MDDGRDDAVTTRGRLLAATVELVGERGYARTTVGEIARRAGLTTGAIYSNYRTKDELVAAAMASRHERLFQEALEVGAGSGSMADVMLGVLTTEATVDHRSLLEAVATASRDPELAASMLQRLDQRGSAVAHLLDEAKADGRIDPELDTESLAHLFHLIGLGNAVVQALGAAPPSRPELAEVLERIAAALGAPDR